MPSRFKHTIRTQTRIFGDNTVQKVQQEVTAWEEANPTWRAVHTQLQVTLTMAVLVVIYEKEVVVNVFKEE